MDPEYANSDRAELCGLLAIVAKLLELCQKAKKWLRSKDNRKVVIYTDSASSITLLEKKNTSYNQDRDAKQFGCNLGNTTNSKQGTVKCENSTCKGTSR